MSISTIQKPTTLHPSEFGVCADEFCAIAQSLDSVLYHLPCVFIKTDNKGQRLGWCISVFSPKHGEAAYLVAKARTLRLFPNLDAAMLFLQQSQVFTFNVSSAM